MSVVHFTLQRRFNKKLLLAWGLGAAVVVFVAKPWPVLPAALGLVSGLAIGVLQVKSMVSAPNAFARATSAIAVRRAFWTTASGRWAIILLWVAAGLLLLVSLFWGGNPLRGYLAGYCLLMLIREGMTLRALKGLPTG